MKYYIQDYFSGMNIVKKNDYTRYFKTLNDADDFLELLNSKGYNDDDDFFVVAEDEEGNLVPIYY